MITLSHVKAELDITGTKYDPLLGWLIQSIESVWDQLTNKTWANTEHAELHDGNKNLFLNNYPVTALTNITTSSDQAFKVKNTTTGATASVSVSPTVFTYVLNGTSATLDLTTYTTITTLVAAINAIGNNWIAEAYSNMGSKGSAELLPVMGLSCADGYIDLSIPDDYLEDFTLNADTGQILGVFPHGFQNIRVKYTAGYTDSTCPIWLKQTLIRQVSHWYLQATEKRWHVSSMQLGDGGTITYNQAGKMQEINLLPDFKNMAFMHRNINV